MNIILKFVLGGIFSAGASGCCSFYLNTNKYDIGWAALAGAIGWVVTLIASHFGVTQIGSYFLGAFAVSIFAELFAHIVKNPATVYLLPGLLPLVPGGGMFNTMKYVVEGEMETAMQVGFNTLGIAGAIALGIAIGSSIARLLGTIAIKKEAYSASSAKKFPNSSTK